MQRSRSLVASLSLSVVAGTMGDRAGAQTVGNWLPPVQFPTNYVGCSGSTEPVYAVHAHLIPVGVHRGKVLIWGRGVNAACWFQYLLTAPGDYDQQFAIVDADANPVTVTYGVWRIPAAAAPPLFGVSYTIPGPTPITVTNGVQGLFCAGHCWLPDGRLMVFGGTDWSAPITDPYAAFTGSRLVAIYDPRGPGLGSWSTVQQLQPTMPHLLEPRWYATAVVTVDTTAAGRVIKVVVLGGVEQVIEGAHPAGTPVNRIIAATDRAYLTHEAYDVEQGLGTDWTITKDIRQGGALPPNYNPNTPVDGLFIGPTSSPPVPPNFLRGWGLFYYSRAHYLSNGVFGGAPAYAGGITWAGSMPLWTTWIDHPVNPNLWSTPHPSLPISTDILEEATAVLLPASLLGGGEDRIALFGGQDGLDHNGNLLTEVFVLDAKQVSPFWSTSIIPALPEARKFTNSVLLPDSSVLITGGAKNSEHGAEGGEQFHPLLTRGLSWIPGPPEDSPRTYHSCSLLLRSGRVLSIGGDTRTWDMQVYEPHYIQAGNTRPLITSSPATIPYATNFTVNFTLAPGRTLLKASLTTPGSVTHSHDPNQRIVELGIVSSTSSSATLSAPANPTKAPYGHYMLWLVDSVGEVSVAAWTEL